MVVHIQARLRLIRLGFTQWAPSHSALLSPHCPPLAIVGPKVVQPHKKKKDTGSHGGIERVHTLLILEPRIHIHDCSTPLHF